MINYTVVSTSNTDYQAWQIKLLIHTFDKVKQQGKLLILDSEDVEGRPFENYEKLSPNVIHQQGLPNWAKKWEQEHNDWYGGIPNKYESCKWLLDRLSLKEEDTLMFIDPDMVFIRPVDINVVHNEIVAQKWQIGYDYTFCNNILDNLVNRSKEFCEEKACTVPMVMTVKTLRTITPSYITFSKVFRKITKNWIAEMYGLFSSILVNNVNIITVYNLGHATVWWEDRNTSSIGMPNIIHYPNDIKDKDGNILWSKQSFASKLKVDSDISSRTLSLIERTLLNIVSEYFKSPTRNCLPPSLPLRKYWLHEQGTVGELRNMLDSKYTGAEGYVLFKPWPGGFNNVRMSLELATSIAYISNKTLILPEKYNIYLLEGESVLQDFFTFDSLPVKHMPLSVFCNDILNIESSFEDVKKLPQTFTFGKDYENHVFNFEHVKVPQSFHKGRTVVSIKSIPELSSQSIWCFDEVLLGSFYQVLFTSKMAQLKILNKYFLHYRDFYFEEVSKLSRLPRNYHSIHVRRNDLQYKDVFVTCQEIYDNIKNRIPTGSNLYIATDHRDRSYFNILAQHYKLFFFSDIVNNWKDYDHNHIPILEQIICSRALSFTGTAYSTLSSYIYRLRQYWPDIEDKNYYVYTSQHIREEMDVLFEEDSKYVASWYREYKDVNEYKAPSIFVSIASYCDQDLINTLKDIYTKSSGYTEIDIGIHIQDTQENYIKFLENVRGYSNINIKFTPKDESKGVVWARNCIVREMYSDQDYYLQIDSHTRFKENWDEVLINQYESIEDNQVIISTYANEYILEEGEEYLVRNPNNTTLSIGSHLEDYTNLLITKNSPPLRPYETSQSKWVSAHFLFTKKDWIREVSLPSEIKFKGEEDLLTYLSYLRGYNVYVPSEATVWHLYSKDKKLAEQNASSAEEVREASLIIERILEENVFKRSVNDLENFLEVSLRNSNTATVLEAPKNNTLHVLTWSIGINPDDPKFRYQRQSARLQGIYPLHIGVGNTYVDHKCKILTSYEAVKKLPSDEYVLFVDGFDTLFLKNINDILKNFREYNTDILFSAEKLYSWHWGEYKHRYDEIQSKYRYLCGGCYMGKVKAIRSMLEDVINSERYDEAQADQELYGKWMYDHMNDSTRVQLDTKCKVFWNLPGDWEIVEKRLNSDENALFNEEVDIEPCIIHAPSVWNYHHIYHRLYHSIIQKSTQT